jgi:hypothetical protein
MIGSLPKEEIAIAVADQTRVIQKGFGVVETLRREDIKAKLILRRQSVGYGYEGENWYWEGHVSFGKSEQQTVRWSTEKWTEDEANEIFQALVDWAKKNSLNDPDQTKLFTTLTTEFEGLRARLEKDILSRKQKSA